jgi:hypothetical protein
MNKHNFKQQISTPTTINVFGEILFGQIDMEWIPNTRLQMYIGKIITNMYIVHSTPKFLVFF